MGDPLATGGRPQPTRTRLGLFGGSFDPVHNGHLRVAACCAEQAGLDQVWFIPTAIQPLKQGGPSASDADRLAMLELAIAGSPGLRVCSLEIDRGGVSYTVDTLRRVTEEFPEAELFFIMGADTLAELGKWRASEEVLRLATPLVVGRRGDALSADAPPHERVEMPPVDISSSDIRARIAAGEPIDSFTPAAVLDYIQTRGLYRQAP